MRTGVWFKTLSVEAKLTLSSFFWNTGEILETDSHNLRISFYRVDPTVGHQSNSQQTWSRPNCWTSLQSLLTFLQKLNWIKIEVGPEIFISIVRWCFWFSNILKIILEGRMQQTPPFKDESVDSKLFRWHFNMVLLVTREDANTFLTYKSVDLKPVPYISNCAGV